MTVAPSNDDIVVATHDLFDSDDESLKSFESFGDTLPHTGEPKKNEGDTSFDTADTAESEEDADSFLDDNDSDFLAQASSASKLRAVSSSGVTAIDLLPFEENFPVFEAAISTLTWFEGDAHEAMRVILPRIQAILCKNPWLLGSLRGSSPMRLEYNAQIEPDASDVDKVFHFSTGILNYEMELTETIRVAQRCGLVLEPAKRLANTNKSLFKVSLVESDGPRFALVVSLCHRIGDGSTFYNLYQMLDPNAEVHALNPCRKLDVIRRIETLMGKKMEEGITGTYFKLLFVRDKMRSILRSRVGASVPKFEQKIFLLDQDYLDAVKYQDHSAECDFDCQFLSKNDVITSTCFNMSKPDYGIMAINLRGRVPNCDRHDAPNYIDGIFYGATDYKTPQHIRASISGETYQPASGPETKFQLNRAKNLIKHIHLSICTNWVTFAPKGGLSLGEAFHQRIHVPLKDMSYAPPSLMSNFTIFAPWAGAIALAVSGSPELVGKFPEHPLVLREIVPGE